MKMITLLNSSNKPIAINTDKILTIYEDPLHEGGIIIDLITGGSIAIPHTSIEEVCAKINQTNISNLTKMTDALCQRIQHLEEQMVAGLQYVGGRCH